jgi:hypothetical protein
MSVFEFFTVLLSFIISLGIASLLSAVARLLQDAGRVRFSWSYALWAAAIFNIQILYWLKSWSYHDTYALRPANFGPPLVLAMLAFLACGLATPPTPDEGEIDLIAFHDRQGPKYMLTVAAYMTTAIVQGALMGDYSQVGGAPADAAFPAGLAIMTLAAAVFHRVRWLQVAAPTVHIVASISYYGILLSA